LLATTATTVNGTKVGVLVIEFIRFNLFIYDLILELVNHLQVFHRNRWPTRGNDAKSRQRFHE